MRAAAAHSRQVSAAAPPENTVSPSPAPRCPSVECQVSGIGPSVNNAGPSRARRQKGPLIPIRNFTLLPICGTGPGVVQGSIAIRFQTSGGADRITSSALSTRPSASVTRAPSVGDSDRSNNRTHQHLGRADPFDEFPGQLLITALAAIDFRLAPVFFEPAALDHREDAEIALPLRHYAVVGFQQGMESRSAERRCVERGDP